MNYDECLRSTYFDLESWLIVLLGLGISVILWRYGKTSFAIMSALAGLFLALSWAYLSKVCGCCQRKLQRRQI